MRRSSVVTAVMGLAIPLLTALPAQATASVPTTSVPTTSVPTTSVPAASAPVASVVAASVAADTVPPADVQSIGPGQYHADTDTFEIAESDVAEGQIGRRHSVTTVDGTASRPRPTPASRTDLSVFGPGWQAEFLGGTTGRALQVQDGSIIVTDLDSDSSTAYTLKTSIDLPGGAYIRKYEAEDGSKLTESTGRRPGPATIVETIPIEPGDPEDGGFTNGSGEPADPADLAHTYTWKQVGDAWRVTGVGNNAYGTSSVTYDAQGRVATVTEPAAGDEPQSVLAFRYATTTTAAGTGTGDYAGRLKEITLQSGSGSPAPVATYAYDASGLLRTMADPRLDGAGQAAYAYDGVGRLTTVDSASHGDWRLAFAGDSAAPAATATSDTRRPDTSSGTPPDLSGDAIKDPDATGPSPDDFSGDVVRPFASPSYCSAAVHWMWYTRVGCAAWAAHYGWKYPSWKKLPTGYWVVGVHHDYCTGVPARPSRWKFDFRPACDMHDYGYGLIGNTYKKYKYYLDRNRKSQVDDVFYVTMRDWTCPAYKGRYKGVKISTICKQYAWTYRQGVRFGNPKNGADKT
ncbi:phospholipase A2 [Nonomuraea sp. NPDC050691]|uniref:phospholipase A2 n=1 Tax=Nonomuraea sp. NPDC050691 TaxID=3155661 RepID=UPI003404AEA3